MAGGFVHSVVDSVFDLFEFLGRVEFGYGALIHDYNSVRVVNSVDSVGDGQNGTIGKLFSDRLKKITKKSKNH